LLSIIGGDLQDVSQLTDRLGSQWNCMSNLLKFYPGGHGMHHFMESLNALMNDGLRPQDIEQIACHAPAERVEFHFEPREEKLHPSPLNARYSLPYVLARLVTDRDVDASSFTPEKIAEPAIVDLARRVTYVSDEGAWLGEKRGLVVVKLRDGRTLQRSSPELRGFPNRPHNRADVVDKFKANARLVCKNEKRLDDLTNALENLEKVKDVSEITRLTTPE
jgi:2-methylcitrate dehydratase PrpD